mmetsp:Transcript_6260/g.18285  ORF Transcript_6260/g.18285 Transcript_6260/m.18285 type:complete len:101 (-) Transcript_6260:715-1017(-)
MHGAAAAAAHGHGEGPEPWTASGQSFPSSLSDSRSRPFVALRWCELPVLADDVIMEFSGTEEDQILQRRAVCTDARKLYVMGCPHMQGTKEPPVHSEPLT